MTAKCLVLNIEPELAQKVANQLTGVRYAGPGVDGCYMKFKNYQKDLDFHKKYSELFEEKYGYPIGYKDIASAPEDVEIPVMWGNKKELWEFGRAIRIGEQWFIRSEPNPHANNRSCAVPVAWK